MCPAARLVATCREGGYRPAAMQRAEQSGRALAPGALAGIALTLLWLALPLLHVLAVGVAAPEPSAPGLWASASAPAHDPGSCRICRALAQPAATAAPAPHAVIGVAVTRLAEHTAERTPPVARVARPAARAPPVPFLRVS